MGQVGAMGVAPEGPCSPLVCWGGAAAGSSWGRDPGLVRW
jgi:hypothetical protein